jgi:hypothetical protein
MTVGSTTRETRDSASEIKFLLNPETAVRLRERARSLLSPDPHASGPSADEYISTTVYFDTADYAVYGRRGSYRRAKYRIRRYDRSPVVFLERKLRTSGMVTKRRTAVPLADLPRLLMPDARAGWSGAWFHERLLLRRMEAVCQVSYVRTARVGMTDYGPIRLTIDAQLYGLAVEVPDFAWVPGAMPLTSACIAEMKFRGAMPVVFKRLVDEFALMPEAISKYRLGILAARPGVEATAAQAAAAMPVRNQLEKLARTKEDA